MKNLFKYLFVLFFGISGQQINIYLILMKQPHYSFRSPSNQNI